ncbi:hypothetical protein CPC16_002418 [Podila verticillata]|nr:hypothetical protein CPC16_002418 [Podila verticillata]
MQMLPVSFLPPGSSGLMDPALEIIRRTRDDHHFTHLLFEIVLFELAACTKTHKPMVPLNLTVLLRAWNHARSVLSKFDKLASASEEYSRVAQEVPDDAGFEHCMSLFELQVVTAPFAFSAAHLHRYLNDPFRASLLVARELTVVDLPGMSEDFFALRALTAADHERYWTFYNNLVSPKFHDRYSAMVFGLRELWKDIGTGGRSVTLIEPYRLKGVEKYSRSYNINRVLKEQGLAHLPPITSTQPDAAPSSLISNGNATPPAIPTTPPSAKSATPPPAKTVTPISKTTATTSTKATAKTPAKTTATATTASKDKNSGRPALADTQVPKGTPSKPAPTSSTSSKASTTGVDDDFENNEEYFKFMVSEWKKTLDLTNSRLIRIRVNAFIHCDYFSESATAAMADFSNSQLVNICLFADVFNRMLLRRDKDIEKGRQRLIREHSTRKTDTRNIKNTTTTTSSTAPTKVTTPTTSTTTTTTTTSSTAPTKVNTPTTSTTTATSSAAPTEITTPSTSTIIRTIPGAFPGRKIATARNLKATKAAPNAPTQATNGSAAAAAQAGLNAMRESLAANMSYQSMSEDSETDSDLPDLLDSDVSDDDSGTDADLPDLLDSDAGSGTDSDLPDLLDSDNNNDSETDDDLPDLLDSDVEEDAKKSNEIKANESSGWETEPDLPDLLDSHDKKEKVVANKNLESDTDSDLPDLLDSESDSGTDSDLPDLLDSSEEVEEEDDDDKNDSEYVFSESDSETGSESSGDVSDEEEKDPYGTKLMDTLPAYLIEANLLRNTRVWTEKITQQYLEKAKSGISEQELASSRERDLAYLYLCDLRFEDPMNAPDFEDEEYFPSDEDDNDGSVSTEYSDDDEADMDISDSEATALVMDYTHMDEDGTQSLVNYLESERQLETTHEWIEFQERRLQDPEGTVAQTQRERAERIEQVVEKRAAIAEEMEKVALEIAEQEWIACEKAEKERLARERTEQERIAREKAERERGAREKAERERIAREKAEQGRIVREKAEEERLARDKAKPEKLTLEKAVERIREKAEKSERITQQKAEDEKLAFFLAQLEAEQVRRERESAAAQKRAEQLAQEEQERIAQQAGENIERYMQGSAEQRAREQLAQQQELQVRLRLELNAALEQAEKLGTLLVPPSLTDGTTASTLPQPTPVALINGSASAPTLTPTLEGSPLTGSQERSEMSQADMNGDEEDDTRLSAEAQEWSVEESGLVGEAASVNEQRQPRLNETTKWPRGNQIFYNLHGIDFSLGLWRSPGMAFNLMEKEIKEWYPLLIASPEEINMRHHLVQRLQHLFDTKFPGQGLIIRPFGSYVTGLGDNNSDVDMCVYSDFFKPQAMHSDVSFLASWLQSECQMLEVSAITDAKVPIVKFVDNYTSIHCDLNVQHPLGITNSEMIKNYIDIDDRLPVFLMLLKYFAKCHGILDASQGYLCSYALILMGIVFFQEQEKPILPRLQSKFTCPKNGKKKALGAALSEGLVQQRSVLQAGQRFDCTYDTRLPQYKGYGRTNKKPVAQLLYEFFEFFCRRFDYRTMEVNSQMGQFRERNTVARQKKAQLAQERSTGFKTRHAGNGYVYDGDRHVWMSAEEQTFIMNQESAGVVPRSGRSYPPDHAPEFQGSPSTSSSSDMGMNGVNGNNGGRYHDRFGSEPFLCVMDPFITNRNVAGSCRGEKLAKVWRSFDHAYKCLAMGDLTQAFCTPAEANSEVWNGIE